MISRVEFHNYKGFERFSLKLGRTTSILVGPNNAGKSTAIGALRLGTQLISFAKQRKPEFVVNDTVRGRSVNAYRISSASQSFIDENVAYEFRDVEARIEIHFKNKAAVYAAWPVDEPAYFYLEHIPGAQPPKIAVTRRDYPLLGVIQTLTPIEHRESILSAEHVRKNQGSRLASRHFRNQLYAVQTTNYNDYCEFCKYALLHTPEITALELVRSSLSSELDLFFTEAKSRVEKEIYWAGDGLQIWLQLLYHIWRHGNVQTLIIDEPDVYLHPDLQRRLVTILESLNNQVILATHAPEVLAESNREAVIVLDRTRKLSKRITNDSDLSSLNNALGSGFNLRLAKALRSRAALFVEGLDMKVLSNLAKTIGATKFHREDGLSVVPMGGSSKRKLAESFGWLNSAILGSSVQVAVLLDRDYLDDESADGIISDFKTQNVFAHIWTYSELENYLLSASAMSRISRIPVEEVKLILEKACEELKEDVIGQVLAREIQKYHHQGEHAATTVTRTRKEFDNRWKLQPSWKFQITPGKDIISVVNRLLQEAGGKAVSIRALSSTIKVDEIPREMVDTLQTIENMLA